MPWLVEAVNEAVLVHIVDFGQDVGSEVDVFSV